MINFTMSEKARIIEAVKKLDALVGRVAKLERKVDLITKPPEPVEKPKPKKEK